METVDMPEINKEHDGAVSKNVKEFKKRSVVKADKRKKEMKKLKSTIKKMTKSIQDLVGVTLKVVESKQAAPVTKAAKPIQAPVDKQQRMQKQRPELPTGPKFTLF